MPVKTRTPVSGQRIVIVAIRSLTHGPYKHRSVFDEAVERSGAEPSVD